MSHLLEDYLSVLNRTLRVLDEEQEGIDLEIGNLARLLEASEDKRRNVDSRRAMFKQAEAIYRQALGEPMLMDTGTGNSPVDTGTQTSALEGAIKPLTQPRARIGVQRYRILHALRESGELDRAEISNITGLDRRRVKDQVVSDSDIGVVSMRDAKVSLTDLGLSLLGRFEASRTARGLALPSLSGDVGEDDGAEESAPHASETQTMEEMLE